MSDLDVRPQEYVSTCDQHRGPETLVLTARKVYLGETTEVARALPERQIRMSAPGASWTTTDPRTSARPRACRSGPIRTPVCRPSAGCSRARSSTGTAWVRRPSSGPASGERCWWGRSTGSAPTHSFSPLTGADLRLEPGAEIRLAVDPEHEYGVFVVAGNVQVEDTVVGLDQLVYLGTHRKSITVRCARSARVMILGGEPYAGEIVMLWNFIGRSHDEIVGYRRAWQARTDRFPAVVDRAEKVMEAPPMPSVALRPRPRRAVPR